MDEGLTVGCRGGRLADDEKEQNGSHLLKEGPFVLR